MALANTGCNIEPALESTWNVLTHFPVFNLPASLQRYARTALRSETTLPIKWIAARVQIGTAKGAKSVLHHLAQSQDQRETARALEPCAQLEFQSTV